MVHIYKHAFTFWHRPGIEPGIFRFQVGHFNHCTMDMHYIVQIIRQTVLRYHVIISEHWRLAVADVRGTLTRTFKIFSALQVGYCGLAMRMLSTTTLVLFTFLTVYSRLAIQNDMKRYITVSQKVQVMILIKLAVRNVMEPMRCGPLNLLQCPE